MVGVSGEWRVRYGGAGGDSIGYRYTGDMG